MKKLLYLLLLIPFGFLASCQSDEDLPQVTIDVTFDNVAYENGVLYVVQGEEWGVQSISVKSLNGENTTLANVGYSLDNTTIDFSNVAPYSISFDSALMPIGTHLLDIGFNVLQVNKPISNGVISYYVKVVESADQIPNGVLPGEQVLSSTIDPKN